MDLEFVSASEDVIGVLLRFSSVRPRETSENLSKTSVRPQDTSVDLKRPQEDISRPL